MSIDNKRKKPSLKATLAGGMKSLIDEVDAKDVKAQEEVVAQNSVSDELEHENNSFNNASDQGEKDFDNVLEYYKEKNKSGYHLCGCRTEASTCKVMFYESFSRL